MVNNDSGSVICGNPVSDSLMIMLPAVPGKEIPSVLVGNGISLKVASYLNEMVPLEFVDGFIDEISEYEDEEELFDDEI